MEPAIIIELILWICIVIFLFILFGLFLLKGFKEKGSISKKFFFSVSFFFLCIGIQRCLSIIFDFFIASLEILFIINIFMLISAIPFLYHLENSVINSKRILSLTTTILVIIFTIVYIIFGYNRILMYYFYTPPFILGIGSVTAIYLYLIIKGSGQIRRNATIVLIGLINMFVFWFLHSQFGRAAPEPAVDYIDLIGIISPIGIVAGLSFLAYGFLKRRQ
ncbi:MAG: hypothetical protein ACTSR8_14335 [Promethearchaeota archaeon]